MNATPGTNRPVWTAESTHPELIQPLKDALSQVIDPEIGYTILQLGLVRDVQVFEHNAVLNMILTTPFCPYGPAILDAARHKAEEGLNMPVEISLGMDMWDFSMMEEGLGGEWGIF